MRCVRKLCQSANTLSAPRYLSHPVDRAHPHNRRWLTLQIAAGAAGLQVPRAGATRAALPPLKPAAAMISTCGWKACIPFRQCRHLCAPQVQTAWAGFGCDFTVRDYRRPLMHAHRTARCMRQFRSAGFPSPHLICLPARIHDGAPHSETIACGSRMGPRTHQSALHAAHSRAANALA